MDKAAYLFSYDISLTARRNRVFKLLSANAIPMQKSVFVLYDYREQAEVLWRKVFEVADPQEDKLFCITLHTAGMCKSVAGAEPTIQLVHESSVIDALLNGRV
jgi:CRISPR-associated endonuclease Cas2